MSVARKPPSGLVKIDHQRTRIDLLAHASRDGAKDLRSVSFGTSQSWTSYTSQDYRYRWSSSTGKAVSMTVPALIAVWIPN
jgi:hypothetical protein